MKVFIYHVFLSDDLIANYNAQFSNAYRLHQHIEYLDDMYNFFKKFETENPDEADYFFVPLFLLGWQFVNHDPIGLIEQGCPFVARGRHLLLSTGDFGQRKRSKYEIQNNPNRAYRDLYPWLDERFSLIALESTSDLLPQDIAFLPYPTKAIAPRGVERDILISFMGAMRHEWLDQTHIRGGRLAELARRTNSSTVMIGSPEEVAARLGRSISYHDLIARSVFTLSPAGYGRWTFRFVEALALGSIPIIVSDGYVMPFSDRINWSDYCLFVDEKDLFSLDEVVGAIPIAVVYRLQANIKRDRHLFQRDFSLDAISNILSARIQSPSQSLRATTQNTLA